MAHPINMNNIVNSTIIQALENGNVSVIKKAILNQELEVNNSAVANYHPSDPHGWTPLLVAIYSGAFDVVHALLDHDASVRVLTGKRDTALHILLKGIYNRKNNHNHNNNIDVRVPPKWQTCMTRLIKLEQELGNMQNENGQTPMSLACYFGQKQPVLILYQLLGISCMASVDTRGKCPMFHLLEGVGTSTAKCNVLHSLAAKIGLGKEIEALVACRIQLSFDGNATINSYSLSSNAAAAAAAASPSSVSSAMNANSNGNSMSDSSPHQRSPNRNKRNKQHQHQHQSIVSDDHPLSFLNEGLGDTLLHFAISIDTPDPSIIAALLDHSGFGSSSILHLADIQSRTAIDRIRLRVTNEEQQQQQASHDVAATTNESSIRYPMIVACLTVIETHMDVQDAESQRIATALLKQEDQEKQETQDQKPKVTKRRKRKSKRARRRQKQKEMEIQEHVEQDLLLEEASNMSGLLADMTDMSTIDMSSLDVDAEKMEQMNDSAALLDLLLAGNVAPSRPFFPNNDDNGGGWLNVGPHGIIDTLGNSSNLRNGSNGSNGNNGNGNGNGSPHRTHYSNSNTAQSNHTQQHYHHSSFRTLSPIVGPGNNNGNGSHTHNSSMSSLDVSPSSSHVSQQSPPISPASFVLTGGSNNHYSSNNNTNTNNNNNNNNSGTSNNGNNDWASIASSASSQRGRQPSNNNYSHRNNNNSTNTKKQKKNNNNTNNNNSTNNNKRSIKRRVLSESVGNDGNNNRSQNVFNHNNTNSGKKKSSSSSLSIDRSDETMKRNNERVATALSIRRSPTSKGDTKNHSKNSNTYDKSNRDSKSNKKNHNKKNYSSNQSEKNTESNISPKETMDLFETETQKRLLELFPLSDAVNVTSSHLVPVRKDDVPEYASECSAAQLDLMEKIHRAALDQITAIRMERTRQSTMDEIAEMLQRGLPIASSKSKKSR